MQDCKYKSNEYSYVLILRGLEVERLEYLTMLKDTYLTKFIQNLQLSSAKDSNSFILIKPVSILWLVNALNGDISCV